jgi:hypothetical protein
MFNKLGFLFGSCLISLTSTCVLSQTQELSGADTLEYYRQSVFYAQSVSMKISMKFDSFYVDINNKYHRDEGFPHTSDIIFRRDRDNNRAEWLGQYLVRDSQGDVDLDSSRITKDIANGKIFVGLGGPGLADLTGKRDGRFASLQYNYTEKIKGLLEHPTGGGPLFGKMYGSSYKSVPDLLGEASNLHIHDKTESINGVVCFVFEGTSAYGKTTAWIAPEKGYNAMKWVIEKASHSLYDSTALSLRWPRIEGWQVTYNVKELYEIPSEDRAIFVPKTSYYAHSIHFRDGTQTVNRGEYETSDIQLKPDFAALGAFEIDLPDGTRVFNADFPSMRHIWLNGKPVLDIDTSLILELDHVANLNYTVGQSPKGALDSIELKSNPDSIEKGEHSNRQPSATDANIPIELVDMTVKDEVINPLMDVFKEVHPNQPEQDYDFAQKCLRDAINKARVIPTSEQIEEIRREIKRIGQVWEKHSKVVRSPDFSCTVQLLVYWYLTPPRLSKADAMLVKNQHKELVEIVAKLPKRLIEEFNAPKELEKEIEQLFGIGLNDFKTFIESPLLRFSQVPVVSARFEELKRTMENHILQHGEQLSRQLEENVKDWRRDVNMQRNLRSWDRRIGRDLLADQYTSCKHFATFMCGGAMSDFEMSIMRILYRKSKTELFPFYRVDTYGTKYEVGIGWLFRIRPKITLSPKSGPNTPSSSQKMISEEEGQRQSSEQTAP